MATVADRVRETTSTTGTGALTLAGATPGCRTFNAAIGNAVPCFYTLLDANGTGWECGIGQLSSSTSFTRTTIQKSSNANAAISLSAGTHTLMCALTEGWASTFNVDASGNVGIGGAPVAKLGVVTTNPGVYTGNNGWSAGYVAIGRDAYSATGAALGFGYDNTNDIGNIFSLQPGVAWKPLNLNALDFRFNASGSEVFRIDTNGNPIFKMTATPPTLTVNSQVTFNLTSNTNLRISARGSDGVTRVANITLA